MAVLSTDEPLFSDEWAVVKGGAMKDHRGGDKLYHPGALLSINVRANC